MNSAKCVSVLRMAAVLVVSGVVVFAAEGQKAPAKAKKKRRVRKPKPALVQIKDVPGLPRVLLIGDSISMGYTLPTRRLLEGKANVHRIATNGGPTKRGLAGIDKWLGSTKWDVIHFNWGLHDLKRMPDGNHQVPLAQYSENLRKLVVKLKASGATLIWAATTPVPADKLKPPRSNDDVIAYNSAAKAIMDENGIVIDDLYAFALPILGALQRPANVHFTKAGSAELAKQVASSIETALKK
ncbi:MAG: SGNH/GDSL hydrolase family protein [Lentisphaeria bacterium]|nr:SGNH/GDSL hydrolase family protein [Lentisphaeria bacterium]